ncbi:MAG: response regulator [Anaerolineae bacterium]
MTEHKSILVIDDDPDFLAYVQIVLGSNGYEVRTASTAAEGMDMMRRDPPRVVIVDVMMSYVLDGWSVTRDMSYDPNLCEIPVLMVSAIVSQTDDPLFPLNGAARMDAFLSKPVDPTALVRQVQELVAVGKEGRRV